MVEELREKHRMRGTLRIGAHSPYEGQDCTKTEKKVVKNLRADLEGPVRARDGKRSPERNREEASGLFEISDYESEAIGKLGESISVVSNPVRIRMLAYCLKERSFTDIMLTLRLNPASLKHHLDMLLAAEYVEKAGKGKSTRYGTTDLGKKMLDFLKDVLQVVAAT